MSSSLISTYAISRITVRSGLIGTVLALSAACAASINPINERPVLLHRDPISASAIAAAHVETAYDAVLRLQPSWLLGHGARSHDAESRPVVYLNDHVLGGVDQLRELPVENIREIQFLSAIDATTRFGSGHVSPVIIVRTLR